MPPLAQPAGRESLLDRLAARVMHRYRDVVDNRRRFDADGPLAACRDRRPPRQAAGGDLWFAVPLDEQPAIVTALPGLEGQHRSPGDRAGGSPSVRAPAFDLEQVSEVSGGGERYHAGCRERGGVADGDVFAHAATDIAAAYDQQVVTAERAVVRQVANERDGIGFGPLHGQGLRHASVDRECPVRQHARVADEQPVRLSLRDVAAGFADAEGGTLDEGHRATRHSLAHRLLAGRPRTGHPSSPWVRGCCWWWGASSAPPAASRALMRCCWCRWRRG